MKQKLDPRTQVNLSDISVLLLEGNQHALDILGNILTGFGARNLHRCLTVEEAERVLASHDVDLLVVEPALREDDGLQFLKRLRSSGREPNRFAPVVMIHGHVRSSEVARMRDSGANFVIAKPLTPGVLLQRIMWVAADRRPFVEMGDYIGPDRRFKFEGPPQGSDGRRGADAKDPLGEMSAPNLSQSEIDRMIKPQRVSL
jgi:CheY-like chemotaxis protein